MLARAHAELGALLLATGQFPSAREHYERAVDLFGTHPSRNSNLGYYATQHSPHALAAALAILGYPLTALRKSQELLAARRLSSGPFPLAIALLSDCVRHMALRDDRMVAQRAEEILSIAAEHEMPFYSIAATFYRGWARAAAGRAEEGIVEMRRSISDPMLAEAVSNAIRLVALAEACGKNGRVEEGLDWVAQGLATAEQTGLRLAEAELHRVKGELLMIKDPSNVLEGEHCLRTAIDVARRQGAKFFELRATVSLARLLKQRGETVEARHMLAEIHNWFTEGFDLLDLKDAKALLDELAT